MTKTALDYEAIRQLLARYSVALDLADRAFETCFAPDAYFAKSGLPAESHGPAVRFEGRQAIGDFAAGFFPVAGGQIRHWSSPPLTDGDAKETSGMSFLMALRTGVAPGTGVILTGVHRDRYTKIDDRWYFAAREFTADPQAQHRYATRQIPSSAGSTSSSPASRHNPSIRGLPQHERRSTTV
jgi:hypothetical protein